MEFKAIGSKILEARESRGLSQKQLARKVGCSQSALSNYEKGKRRLYLSQLEQVARALDLPVEYFMEPSAFETATPPEDDDEKFRLRLLNELSELTFEDKLDVMNYIRYIRWRRGRNQNGQF